jgi:site-specific DNA recombinase
MRVAACLRVSTRKQSGDDRFGLPSRRASIATFCGANGYDIVAEFVHAGVSGVKADRPAFVRLLEAAKRGEFDAVIVGQADRLARRVAVDGHLRVLLEQCGVTVLSATERNTAPNDDDGEMIEGMLAVVAQRARKDIVKRLHRARMSRPKRVGTRTERRGTASARCRRRSFPSTLSRP